MLRSVSMHKAKLLEGRAITEELFGEHKVIAMAAVAMRSGAEGMRKNGTSRAELLRGCLEVLTELGDDCHHRKEERVIIPALLSDQMLSIDEELDGILEEHKRSRELLGEVEAALPDVADEDGAKTAVAEAALAYEKLVTAHIRRENTWLFPLVEKRLALQGPILKQQMDVIERQFGGEDKHRRLTDLARELRRETLLGMS